MKQIIALCILMSILVVPVYGFAGEINPQESFDMFFDDVGKNLPIDSLDGFSPEIRSIYPYENAESFFREIAKGNFRFDFSSFLPALFSLFTKNLYEMRTCLLSIMLLCMLSSLVGGLSDSYLSKGISDVAFYAVYASVAGLLSAVFFESIKHSTSLINSLIEIMNAVIPSLLLLLSMQSGVITSAVLSPALLFFTNFATYFIRRILIPSLSFGFILSLVEKMLGSIKLTYLIGFIKKAAIVCLGCFFTLFMGIVSLEGMNFASIDSLGAKTVKYAMSNLIPVVGSFLSSSMDSVLGFLKIIKNAFGLGSVLIIIAVALSPVVKVFVLYLSLRVASVMLQPVTDEKIYSALDSAANFTLMVTVCIITVCVMFISMIALLLLIGSHIR